MTTLPLRSALPAPAGTPVRAAETGRTLLSYLLVPRPKDLVKALVVPLAFALGAAASGGVGATQVWHALVVWGVLELLVYQARYQWNDIRGFAADQAHPQAASRGRLPGPVERARPHISASVAVLALRLGLTALVALAVPELRTLLLLMTLGVFGVAFVYERVRSRATGHSSQLPVPLRPPLIALWVVVGAGYAVRGLPGLALAVSIGGRPGLIASAVVAMWSLGIVFVTCRWALEAMCFARFEGGHVVWDAGTSTAREHTIGLVRWLPSYVDVEDMPATHEPDDWRALHGRTPLLAPWHLALATAGTAAALTGRLLVGGLDARSALVTAVAGSVAAVALTRLRRRWPAALATGAVLSAAQWALGWPHPVAATLPWLVVALAYACFTAQRASEIGRPLRRLEPLLR